MAKSNPHHPGSRADKREIDVDDPSELAHWAQTFNTTEDDVREAVRQVGTEPGKVGDFLQHGRRPHHHPSEHNPPRPRQ